MGYYAIMFMAGVGIPILAALNSGLGRFTGSPAASATVLFIVAGLIAGAVALATTPQGFARMIDAPRHLFLGGALIAFYLLSITWIAPIIGLGNAIFMVLIGQLFAASLIDQFGLFGAAATPITLTRALGIALMGLGVFVTVRL